jgi:hypothetical protein
VKNLCPVCEESMRTFKLEEIALLSHGCMVHIECTTPWIEQQIKENNSLIKCPKGCSEFLSDYDLKIPGMLSEEKYNEYLKIKFYNKDIVGLQGVILCKMPDCGYPFYKADDFDEDFECPNHRCKRKICGRCLNEFHPEKSCQEVEDEIQEKEQVD